MLGGGTFTSQNKVLPGVYINFISAARAVANVSERGVATMPLKLDWGEDGKVIEIDQEEFLKNSQKHFGYQYNSKELEELREIFCHAKKAYIYRLNSGGAKASNLYGDAKCSGTRGNDLKMAISNSVDNEGAFDVKLYLDAELIDAQTVTKASELKDNDYVIYKKDAELAVASGVQFSGGTNGEVTGNSHQDYLNAIEPFTFNAMGVCVEDDITKSLYVAFTKRMRDSVGLKFQCVLYSISADYEGVINVKNSVDLVPWVTGLQAACEVNASCTNTTYDGELAVQPINTGLEAALTAGEFVLHSVGTEVRVLEDINSLVTLKEDKNELFQSNQTIRVIDQIAMDISSLFNQKYHGKIQNDESGRNSLWNDIKKHHQELEKLGAIENFSEEDIVVTEGEHKKGVVVDDKVTVVNTMSQLYMSVVIQ